MSATATSRSEPRFDEPDVVRAATIFQLFPQPRAMALVLRVVALLLVSWLGVNAAWGLADPDGTLVSRWEAQVLPLTWWLAASAGALGLAALVAAVRGRRSMALVSSVLAIYVPATLVGWTWTEAVQWPPAAARVLFIVPAAPILMVLMAWKTPLGELPLRFGSWTGTGRLFGRNPTSWRRRLVLAVGLFVLLIAIPGQGAAGFESVLTGRLWTALPSIVALYVVNAVVEETLFRGLFLPVIARATGAGAAIWLQAFFFGLHHWGSSPTVVQGAVMMLPLTVLGAVWGKGTHDTRGLGWSVSVHAGLGVAYAVAMA
ncbi:MAG: CPBP family intramembrane glutamic endopeptidase [Acidobacteriota bacterium]